MTIYPERIAHDMAPQLQMWLQREFPQIKARIKSQERQPMIKVNMERRIDNSSTGANPTYEQLCETIFEFLHQQAPMPFHCEMEPADQEQA